MLMLMFDVACRDSDSAPSTPRSMSTSAASSPLRAAPFEAAPRLRFSDDGARRQHWGHSASDPGHRASAFPASLGLPDCTSSSVARACCPNLGRFQILIRKGSLRGSPS